VNTQAELPPRLAEIVDDFSYAEGSEKLEMLLEYAESLPPLPAWLEGNQAKMESVPECMTPVSIAADLKDGAMTYYFTVPAESPTVRGYAAILEEGLHGVTPEQVLRLPADFYLQMGLQSVLTMQRMNGMASMVAHVKRLAFEKIASK
jgi:cysteine desulfuration protein SufE